MISARTGGGVGRSGDGVSFTGAIVGLPTTIRVAQCSFCAAVFAPSLQTFASLAQVPATSTKPVPGLALGDWITVINLVAAPLILVLLWAGNVIRPGSLSSGRSVNQHPDWVWFGSAVLIWMTIQIGAGMALQALGVAPSGSLAPRDLAITSGAGYLAAIAAAVVLLRLLGSGPGLGFRLKDLPLGLVCLVLTYPILDVISRLSVWVTTQYTGARPPTLSHESLTKIIQNPSDPWAWTMIALAVVAAPFVEEVIYRGLLQSAILRVTGRVWTSILITAAIFTAAHYTAVPYHAMPTLFILGVALGLAFERTGSLGVPIVAHALFNAANVALALILR
jgi:membrane protease YdiL (CAAX protease family)